MQKNGIINIVNKNIMKQEIIYEASSIDTIEQSLFERLINAVKNKCKRTALARIRDIANYREQTRGVSNIITKHELTQKYLV